MPEVTTAIADELWTTVLDDKGAVDELDTGMLLDDTVAAELETST